MDKQSLQEYFQIFYEPPIGSQYIIFVGNTNSGKSTIINMLLDIRITIKQKSKFKHTISVLQSENPNLKYAQIGNSFESCTRNTEKYEKNGVIMIDTPGQKSTRGDQQKFINTIAMSKLYKEGRKIKQILVVNFNDIISAKSHQFIDFVEMFLKRYPDEYMFQLIQSSVIVISQIDTKENSFDELIEIIQEIGEGEHLSKRMKFFLKFMIEYNNILMFPNVIRRNDFQENVSMIKQKIGKIKFMQILQDLSSIPPINVQLIIRKKINILYKKLGQICQKMQKIIAEKDNVSKSQIQIEYFRLKQIKNIMQSQYLHESKYRDYCFQTLGVQSYQKQFLRYFLPDFEFDQTITSGVITSINNILHNFQAKLLKMKTQKYLIDMEAKFQEDTQKKIKMERKRIIQNQQRQQNARQRRQNQLNQSFMKQYQKRYQIIKNGTNKIKNIPNQQQIIYKQNQYYQKQNFQNGYKQEGLFQSMFNRFINFFNFQTCTKKRINRNCRIFPNNQTSYRSNLSYPSQYHDPYQSHRSHHYKQEIPSNNKNISFRQPMQELKLRDLTQFKGPVSDIRILDQQILELQKIYSIQAKILQQITMVKK